MVFDDIDLMIPVYTSADAWILRSSWVLVLSVLQELHALPDEKMKNKKE